MTEKSKRLASQTSETVAGVVERGQSASNLLGALTGKPSAPPAGGSGNVGNAPGGASPSSGGDGNHTGGAGAKS